MPIIGPSLRQILFLTLQQDLGERDLKQVKSIRLSRGVVRNLVPDHAQQVPCPAQPYRISSRYSPERTRDMFEMKFVTWDRSLELAYERASPASFRCSGDAETHWPSPRERPSLAIKQQTHPQIRLGESSPQLLRSQAQPVSM